MKQSRKTLDQRRSSLLYESNRSPGVLYQEQRKGYVEAATQEMANGGFEGLVISLFGPEFVGSLALALDPTRDFKMGTQVIAEANRFRTLRSQGDTRTRLYKPALRSLEWRNYLFDEDIKVDRFLYSSHDFIDPTVNLVDDYWESSFSSDATNRTRPINSNFGEFELSIFTVNGNQSTTFSRVTDKLTIQDATKGYFRWTRDEQLHQPLGPPFLPNGLPLSPSYNMYGFSMDFIQDEIYWMLPKCLSTKRLFNTFYQITELKDLPGTVRGVLKLKEDIKELCSLGTSTKNKSVNKLLGDQYLNYRFGLESIYQAATGYLRLPSKATKRLNYLISRNNKVTTGRFKNRFEGDIKTPLSDTPLFIYDGPDWLDVASQSVQTKFDVELRLVVNQLITFPTLAVPKFSDKNYRDLLGLNPTIGDLYNLIPWSWLVDYFSSLGDYIDTMDAINSDQQLINYGMCSFISNETTTNQYVLGAANERIIADWDDNVLHSESYDSFFAGSTEYKRHYHTRFDVSRFDGTKVFGNGSGNLSFFQYSILGALLAKFA